MHPENPITITVATHYIDEQSDSTLSRYVFTYSIQITNHSEQPVTLRTRHWLITNADNSKIEVNGDGVVGQQPMISPNHSYRYTSGVVLSSPVGTMEGYYKMERTDGGTFLAPIAPFLLSIPNAVN